MSTWLPKAHAIQETDLKSLEEIGFEWIEGDESLKKSKDDCILLGFYVHPISGTPFAAIVVKDPDFYNREKVSLLLRGTPKHE